MKNSTLNIQIKSNIKAQILQISQEMGMDLNDLINNYFEKLIKTKSSGYTNKNSEEPSEYLIKTLKESNNDICMNKLSPTFSNSKDGINWLNSKYADKI